MTTRRGVVAETCIAEAICGDVTPVIDFPYGCNGLEWGDPEEGTGQAGVDDDGACSINSSFVEVSILRSWPNLGIRPISSAPGDGLGDAKNFVRGTGRDVNGALAHEELGLTLGLCAASVTLVKPWSERINKKHLVYIQFSPGQGKNHKTKLVTCLFDNVLMNVGIF